MPVFPSFQRKMAEGVFDGRWLAGRLGSRPPAFNALSFPFPSIHAGNELGVRFVLDMPAL